MSLRPTEVVLAEVYKGLDRAARLVRQGSDIVFAYDEDHLARRGPPVAFSLPLTSTPVITTEGAVPAFFAGLLPEGARLGALVAQVKTSADDMLSLLLAVGQDTVGDVRVLAEGATLEPVAPVVRASSWEDLDFSRLIENEAFFLAAARDAGLPTASATVVRDREERSGLLVDRFDRAPGGHGGGPRRLAQEDRCATGEPHESAVRGVVAMRSAPSGRGGRARRPLREHRPVVGERGRDRLRRAAHPHLMRAVTYRRDELMA